MPQQPVVVVASLLCLGAVLGWTLLIDWWVLLGVVVSVVGLYIYSRRWWMAAVVALVAGFTSTMVHRLTMDDLSGRGYYRVEVLDEAEGESRGVMRVLSRLDMEDDLWRGCRGEVRFRVADGVELRRGDRATLWCGIGEFRGRYYATIYRGAVVCCERDSVQDGEAWSYRINRWASRRIASLNLDDEAESVVQAMLLGRREMLSGDLVERYRRSGAAHILAISGLHIMIIYLLVSRLLLLLNLLPFGFRLRPIVVALFVWGYAMVVGMTPSVERAAIMFVVMQLFGTLGRRYSSFVGFILAVTIMVLLDPLVLFDVGFMLSVVAVAAILVWVVPIDRAARVWLKGHISSKIARWFLGGAFSIWLVGMVCSVATLPIVSWAFGYLSLFGALLNPLVVITAYLLLILSMMALFLGYGHFAQLFASLIDAVASVQNGAVSYLTSSWSAAVDLQISGVGVVLIYIIYILISIVVFAGDSALSKRIKLTKN